MGKEKETWSTTTCCPGKEEKVRCHQWGGVLKNVVEIEMTRRHCVSSSYCSVAFFFVVVVIFFETKKKKIIIPLSIRRVEFSFVFFYFCFLKKCCFFWYLFLLTICM